MQDRRPLTIRIDEAIYRKLRVYSAESGLSMQTIVEQAITKEILRVKK
jgi:predicted HicB family RNase H-like nuclease